MRWVFLGGKCKTSMSSLQRKDSSKELKALVPPRRELALSGVASSINQFVIWFLVEPDARHHLY
jgi:hypothetical protein